jgi:hypothetical protein
MRAAMARATLLCERDLIDGGNGVQPHSTFSLSPLFMYSSHGHFYVLHRFLKLAWHSMMLYSGDREHPSVLI